MVCSYCSLVFSFCLPRFHSQSVNKVITFKVLLNTYFRSYYANCGEKKQYQRTIGPENAHLKPDLNVLSHHEMTLTLNTHTPLLTS